MVVRMGSVYRYSHDYWVILIFIYILPYIVIPWMLFGGSDFKGESRPFLFATLMTIFILLRTQYRLYKQGRTIFEVDQHGLRYPYMKNGRVQMAEISWGKINDVQADVIDTTKQGARYRLIFYVDSDVEVIPPTFGRYSSGTEYGVFKVLTFPQAFKVKEETNRLFVCKQFLSDYRVKAG